ncbi:hypothetical protein TNCV_2380811 [Trichonephila clavipes]|nr:hypothetical protein TNCV_2380811 [Trichonephila clavipes]
MARRLHKGGMFAISPERARAEYYQQHRLQWCLEHNEWTSHQWSHILFTDKIHFSLSTDSQRQLIWW